MYEHFKKKNPGSDVPLSLYRSILKDYNVAFVDRILAGDELNLVGGAGRMLIRKVKRKFLRKKVDFGETRKLRAKGVNKTVYYTDDHYCVFYWKKKDCIFKNISVYKFVPTFGDYGNVKKLAALLKNDDSAHLNYKLF